LDLVITGDERVSPEILKEWKEQEVSLLHAFGVTEVTVTSVVYPVPADFGDRGSCAAIPIGLPMANTEVYLLDGVLQPTPLRIASEMYLGGEGVARGYLNRPELTGERFTPSPFGKRPGSRLYKSGDLARSTTEGYLEFVGRIDHQVKIRGYRVELGEIEAALDEHELVKKSVVIASEDERWSRRLIGYVVADEGATESSLKKHVRERLPEYMVPEAILLLDEIPLTANGKIDRQRLPSMKEAGRPVEQEYVASRTQLEEMMVGIFGELLKLDRVGINDDFFELGGHSLLAIQVISRVRNAFGVEIKVRSIFDAPTAEGLSRKIAEAMRAGEVVETPPLVRVEREGARGRRAPLSFAQQRLWFIDRLNPGSAVYNIPGAVRLEGGLNLDALERVINEIVRRHEVLRTRFEVNEGEPAQVTDEWEPRRLEVVDLTSLPPEAREEEVSRRAKEEAETGFDLSRGPLFRVKVLKLAEEEYVLLYTMHHVVSDGWSMGILIKEIEALYRAFSVGEESPLEEAPIQYADFAVWQRSWLQGEVLENQLAYWRRQLAGQMPALELPTDRPRPARQSHRGAQQWRLLPAALSNSLKALGLKQDCTLFMTLLAAFNTLLYYLTGQTDITLGTNIANRNRAETENLIGFFVNQLALRADLSRHSTFIDLLREVREITLGAYMHQDLPFEKLVETLSPDRDLNLSPIFQVVIALQNAPIEEELSLPGLTLSPVTVMDTTAKYDLVLNLTDTQGGLDASLQYSADLFDENTARRILNRFHTLLDRIVDRPDAGLRELVESLTEEDKRERLEQKSELESVRLRKLKSVKRRTIRETRGGAEQ
jgi:acyl carrier protein